jgi:hypothetical protein
MTAVIYSRWGRWLLPDLRQALVIVREAVLPSVRGAW